MDICYFLIKIILLTDVFTTLSVSSDITHLIHYAHIPKRGLCVHKYHLSPCVAL